MKSKFYNQRSDVYIVLKIQDHMNRVLRLMYTAGMCISAVIVAVLAVMSIGYPVFIISNDFEYIWNITGSMFLNGITVNGVAVTAFNPVILIFYILAAISAVAAFMYLAANIVHAKRAKGVGTVSLEGKMGKRFRLVIGGSLTADAAILMLFEPVYNLTKTAKGSALLEEFSVNFSFNNYPSFGAVMLMLGVFFVGTYFLCSAIKDTVFWKKHQGLIYISGIVALVLYFWQYGYLHQLFGIDPSTSSFPYPFPKALNSYSNFTGGVKGDYNSVFGSLVSTFVNSSSDIFNDSILYNSVTTVSGMLIGYILGGALGYAVAVVASCSVRWGKGVLTICTILVSFPVVALGPIVNHWFPSNSYLLSWIAKVIVVTILCMAGMSVNAYKGLTATKPFTIDLMSVCNADPKTTLLKLRIPNSLPNVFTALKTNSATALMGAFVCEFYSLSKTYGIGMMFNNYWNTARFQSWAYIIMSIVYGLVLYLIVSAVENRTLGWYRLTKKK